MKDKVQAWNDARKALQDAQQAVWQAETLLLIEIARTVGRPSAGLSLSEEWDCKDSPTGMCVFDRGACIFCHEPSERK